MTTLDRRGNSPRSIPSGSKSELAKAPAAMRTVGVEINPWVVSTPVTLPPSVTTLVASTPV